MKRKHLVALVLLAFAGFLVWNALLQGEGHSDASLNIMFPVDPQPNGITLDATEVAAKVPALDRYTSEAQQTGRAHVAGGDAARIQSFLESKARPDQDWRAFQYKGQWFVVMVTV